MLRLAGCLALLGAGCWFLAGCAYYQARPLAPAKTAETLMARSLADDGLHRFLVENLGREPERWPPETWDFETLTWVAFYYQPSLEVARAQWAVARAAVKSAGARPNPVLSVVPGYDTSVPSGVSPWFPSVSVDFLIETARKRTPRIAIEEFNAEAARLEVLSAAWQVRSELRSALIAAAAADRRQVLVQRQVEAQQEQVALLDRRLKAGAVSAYEVSVARVALVKAEVAAADARRQVPLTRSRVAQALGLPLSALAEVRFADLLAGTPAPVVGEELAAARRQSLQSRADVLAALARYEASQSGLQLEVARQYPDLHLGPGYQYDLGENKWSLGLSLELPIFNRNEGPLAEAEARRREAAARFVAVQARVIAEIDGAGAAQAAAAGQSEHWRRVQTELQKQSDLLQARVTAGNADRLELQNAKIELISGEAALFDAAVAATEAAGQLEDALQVPFHDLSTVADARPGDLTSRTP